MAGFRIERPCVVPDCTKSAKHGGSICSMHRHRMERHGSYDVILSPRFDANDQDQVKVRLLLSRTIDAQGCWIWTGARSKSGYGQVGSARRVLYVHRLAAIAWDVDGSGPWVLHTCDVPPCFNPAHLYFGTSAQNTRDMWDRGRAWQQQVTA